MVKQALLRVVPALPAPKLKEAPPKMVLGPAGTAINLLVDRAASFATCESLNFPCPTENCKLGAELTAYVSTAMGDVVLPLLNAQVSSYGLGRVWLGR